MKGLMKLVLVAALAFGAWYFYTEFMGTSDRALEGTWRSNKEASLLEAERAGISEGRRALLGRLYGRMTYQIEDGVWKATMDGEVFEGTYEVLSRDGDCYELRTNEGDSEVCIRDGQMYVLSEITNSYEVFDKL